MSNFAEGFEGVTREGKDVELVDKHLEPVGVCITIGPKTSKRYQQAQRRLEDRYSTGKKVPVKESRELRDGLFLARIEGWKWHGKAEEKFGQVEFTPANVREFFFDSGEVGRAFLEQVKAAIGDYDDFLPDD
jgi:hypothetical protein